MTNEIVGCQTFFGDCSTIAEPAVAGYYEKAIGVVSATAEMASDLLRTVDEHLAPLLTVLAEWERWRPQIQALIDNLVWLLDGWDVALDFAARNLVDVLDQETIMNKLVALFPSASAPRLGSGLCSLEAIASDCIANETANRALSKGNYSMVGPT